MTEDRCDRGAFVGKVAQAMFVSVECLDAIPAADQDKADADFFVVDAGDLVLYFHVASLCFAALVQAR
jgi:hypothetical protein